MQRRSLAAVDHAPEPTVRRQQRVLMGPWSHAEATSSRLGDLDFGPTALRPRSHGRSKVNNLRTIAANVRQLLVLRHLLRDPAPTSGPSDA